VFFCPRKFVREFKVILFPLDKILKSIPWDDYNFNVVIEAMPSCDMRKPLDIMLLKWSKRKILHSFPSKLELNPFPLK
jgi:glyceraldehyde-3-phosphate dehydrogenase/erythrose-4-phosphate dehydrogenase